MWLDIVLKMEELVIDLDYESTKDLGTYEQYLDALNELRDF